MTEFELIEALKPWMTIHSRVVAGAGDDCAILDLGNPDSQVLLKADAVVEGVHFSRETQPERIGHKALARALSDIAAMGGTPVAAVITLGLPAGYDVERVVAVYRGMNQLAGRHHVAIVGGETTVNPGGWLLNVSLVGTVPRGRAVLRSGSVVGDAIFVSGELGGSISGHHLDFEPRLSQGRWLMESGMAHAMIDLSDGLAGDLPHLLAAAGGLGAELLGSAIPIRSAARERARQSPEAKPALLAALSDGEDFELLWTVAPANAVRVLDGWKAAFPDVGIHCIGRITKEPGVRLRDAQGVRLLPNAGYDHFRS